jgi:hypothetical protein
MASIINSTTTAGVTVTGDNSGSLQLATNNGTTAVTIDTSQNVGIGTTSPTDNLYISRATNAAGGISVVNTNNAQANQIAQLYLQGGDNAYAQIKLQANSVNSSIRGNNDGSLAFLSSTTERMRIDSSGFVMVGTTNTNPAENNVKGVSLPQDGRVSISAMGSEVVRINRGTDDGVLVFFHQAGTAEGNISVSGTTVSYNGGHLSRYAQTTTPKDDTLLKGTVLSNLDEMNEYVQPTTYWTEEDELPEGVNVGDVKAESAAVENEQLNKVKVSDVEGDVNVAGVFVNWSHDETHNVDEINMAMTGDMIIRIAEGVVVQKGDLLMSAGDGTAKPQGDDIRKSKTAAKVTSNHVTCTYADGSYCVPCVLMAC